MKIVHKIKLAVLTTALVSGVAFAAASKPASDLATKNFCAAKAAGNPISVQDAARNAATSLRLVAGSEVLVNSACDGRTFEQYSQATGSAGGGNAGAAAGGGTGTTGGAVAGFSVSTAAVIVGGVLVTAAAVSSSDGDDTPASP